MTEESDMFAAWEGILREVGILKSMAHFAERGVFTVAEARCFFGKPQALARVGGITVEQAEMIIAVTNHSTEIPSKRNDSRARGKVKASAKERKHGRSAKTEDSGNYVGLFGSALASTQVYGATDVVSNSSSLQSERRKRKHKSGHSEQRRDSGRTHRGRASDALPSSASESEVQSERSRRDSRSRSRSHSRKRRGTDKKRERRRRVEERVDSGITSERRHRGRHRDGSEERRQKKHRSSTEKKSKRSRREASPPPALEPGITERQKKRRSRVKQEVIDLRSLSTASRHSATSSVRRSAEYPRAEDRFKPFVESMRKSLESSSSKGSGRNYRSAFDRGEDEERDDADSMQTQHDDDSRDELDEELDTGRKKRRRRLSSKKQDAVEMESKLRTSTIRKRKRKRNEAQADDIAIDSEQRDANDMKQVNSEDEEEEEGSEWQYEENYAETESEEEEYYGEAQKSTRITKKTRTQSLTQAPSSRARGRRRSVASASSSLTQTTSSVSSTREPPSKKRKKTATRSVRVVAEKLPQRELYDWCDFNRRLQNKYDRYNALMKERDPDFVGIDFSQVEEPSTADFKCTAPKCSEAFHFDCELQRHKTKFHDTPPHIKCPVDGCTCAYRVEAIFDIHQRKGHLGDEQPTDKSEECSETKSSEKKG